MNEELKNKIASAAAHVENANFTFDGLTIDFTTDHGRGGSKEHTVGEWKEHGVANIGKIEGSYEGFISKEAFTELMKASVTITLEFIKAAPELIKPVFMLIADAIRAHFELRKQRHEIRKMELELELNKTKPVSKSKPANKRKECNNE